jgi:hypothetical protein
LYQLIQGIGPYEGQSPFGTVGRSFGQALGSEGSERLQNLSDKALSQILSGEVDTKAYEKGYLEPALRGFDREITPRINAGFAGRGATFSTARGQETSRSLGDLYSRYEETLAQGVESAKSRQAAAISLPLQQQLSRIGGLGSLFGIPQQYLGATSSFGTVQPGIGSSLSNLGGTALGLALAGGFGGGGSKGGGAGGGAGIPNPQYGPPL